MAPRVANIKTCMYVSIEIPILTSVERAILENTEVPKPTSIGLPTTMEAATSRSVGTASRPTWTHPSATRGRQTP